MASKLTPGAIVGKPFSTAQGPDAQTTVVYADDPSGYTLHRGPVVGRPFLHALDAEGRQAPVVVLHPDSPGGGGEGDGMPVAPYGQLSVADGGAWKRYSPSLVAFIPEIENGAVALRVAIPTTSYFGETNGGILTCGTPPTSAALAGTITIEGDQVATLSVPVGSSNGNVEWSGDYSIPAGSTLVVTFSESGGAADISLSLRGM